MTRRQTALIHQEDDAYVALCPELDIASQGLSIEEARDNLKEAVELFLECASDEEIRLRLENDVLVTHIEVSIG
ncbi:MAG: type II toxin-antitoxin system HicB family antitoxin [Pirellulales bacterium]